MKNAVNAMWVANSYSLSVLSEVVGGLLRLLGGSA